VLALDLGGTKLATAVFDGAGRLLGRQVTPTEPGNGTDDVLKRLFDLGHRSLDLVGLDRPAAIGITSGGPLDPETGVLHEPLHLPGWIDVPIGPLASEEFGAPAVLQNDGTAAAWGEYRFGTGRGVSTMLYLTLSTGVGGGAVLGGRLHRGAGGNGGEFGHITVRSGGRQCSCPRRGCLEAYCSGTSIGARASEILGRTMTARDVVTAVSAGDRQASALWDETVELLADGLTSLVNLFEPDRVVLGGGVAGAGPMLLDPVQRIVAEQALAAPQIVLAERPDLSALLGAGAVALDFTTISQRSTTSDNEGRHD
jgi:glucokinase